MLVKRIRNFGIPTFGLRNMGRSMGFGQGANMTTGQRAIQGLKGTGKLALVGAGAATVYGASKFAGASKKALTGKMGEDDDK